MTTLLPTPNVNRLLAEYNTIKARQEKVSKRHNEIFMDLLSKTSFIMEDGTKLEKYLNAWLLGSDEFRRLHILLRRFYANDDTLMSVVRERAKETNGLPEEYCPISVMDFRLSDAKKALIESCAYITKLTYDDVVSSDTITINEYIEELIDIINEGNKIKA